LLLFLFFGRLTQENRYNLRHNILTMFSPGDFVVSCLIFKFLIHYEFVFVCGVRECSNFIDLHVAVQFPNTTYLKRLTFLHYIFLSPLLKIN